MVNKKSLLFFFLFLVACKEIREADALSNPSGLAVLLLPFFVYLPQFGCGMLLAFLKVFLVLRVDGDRLVY